MSLLNLFAAARDRNVSKSGGRRLKALDRRRVLGMDCLEERKVMSTSTVAGTFEGMPWVYSYNNTAKTGTLTITDQPGSSTVHITAAHPNLNPGDPGYSAAHVNDVTGIDLSDNDQNGGPSVVVGTKVNIVLQKKAGDHPFADSEPSFAMTTVARTSTTTLPAAPTPAASQSGAADGVSWSYSYNASTKKWNLSVVDRAGSGGVSLSHSGGEILFSSASAGRFDGPTLATDSGATGTITVYQDAGDKAIANRSGYAMSTVARTATQTGTTLGAAWRYVQDNFSGNGTLYVQGANLGSAIWINQTSSHITFDHVDTNTVAGPTVRATARVNIVVARTSGDSYVGDDRNGPQSPITFVSRHDSGSLDQGVAWNYDYNVVTGAGTLTLTSVKGAGTFDINAKRLGLQSGDPGYQSDYNPINGVDISLRGGNSDGGPSIAVGTKLSIVVQRNAGDDQFVNHESSFSVSTVARRA